MQPGVWIINMAIFHENSRLATMYPGGALRMRRPSLTQTTIINETYRNRMR